VQDITSTITEVVTTDVVVSLPGELGFTTLNPAQWLKDGVFDPGYDIPTRTTVMTDNYNSTTTV
jgi:hypothetical protein